VRICAEDRIDYSPEATFAVRSRHTATSRAS
jgi:hypothetical protein